MCYKCYRVYSSTVLTWVQHCVLRRQNHKSANPARSATKLGRRDFGDIMRLSIIERVSNLSLIILRGVRVNHGRRVSDPGGGYWISDIEGT
jgi:hypothetical protein